MGTTTTDVTTEALVNVLASLPVDTLEAIRLGVANERTMCAQNYTYSPDGAKKPVGCLMAAAVWHSPSFRQAVKGLNKRETATLMQTVYDEFDIAQYVGGDSEHITEAIRAFDYWAANRLYDPETMDFESAKKLGAKRTRQVTYKHENDETSTVEMLKPEAKRELLSIVNEAITKNLAA